MNRHIRLALLSGVAIWLAACKKECPPLSIQEGEFCRWTHDAGAAGGGSGQGAKATGAGKAGRSARAGSGGAAATSEGSPDAWTCQQADTACNCVQGDGNGEDSCQSPKPDCCYVYPESGKNHCSCVPLNTPECSELFKRPNAGVAASCPP